MSENEELQNEEVEVLKSIYEGDELYTNPDQTSHHYKFGEEGTLKTFILGRCTLKFHSTIYSLTPYYFTIL